MPLSYTPQYKNLMTRKAEFPNEYAAAKKELGFMPSTVEDCEKILTRMMEMVEAQIDKDGSPMDRYRDGFAVIPAATRLDSLLSQTQSV